MTTNIKQLSSNEDNARLLAIPLEEMNSSNTLGQMPKDLLGVVRGFLSAEDNNSLNKTCKQIHDGRKVRVIDYRGMWDEFKTDPKMRLFMPKETKNYERNIEKLYINMRKHLNVLNGKPAADIKLKGDIKIGLQNLLNEIVANPRTIPLKREKLAYHTFLASVLILISAVALFSILLFLSGVPLSCLASGALVIISMGITAGSLKISVNDSDKRARLKFTPEAPPLGNIPPAKDREPLPPKFELPIPHLKPAAPQAPLLGPAVKTKRKPIPRRSSLDLIFRVEKRANKKVQFPSYEPKNFELTEAERAQLDAVD